jgi:TRAP-type transport system small permease protein
MTSAADSSSPGWLNAVAKGCDYLIALALLLMVIMVFGNVVLRYAFNSGITASEELSRWLFVWMTFLGAIVALKEHAHLGTDMLVARLPRGGKVACAVVSLLLMLWMCWLIFQGSYEQAKINLGNEAPVTGWSMAIVYAAGMVFAVGAAPLLLHQLFRVLTGRMRDDELVMTQESEDLAHVQADIDRVTHERAAPAAPTGTPTSTTRGRP